MSSQGAIRKVTAAETAQGGVLIKLVVFSLSLGIVPMLAYFASLQYFWNGNATYAAITAVFFANIVLVTYIIMSIMEDKSSTWDGKSSSADSKKER